MIIFFGIRSGEIYKDKIEETCPTCNTKDSLQATVRQTFFHVFWAPCFPVEKSGYIQCTNCKTAVASDRLIPHFKTLFLEVQAKARTPFWAFLGPMLFLLLIGLIIIESEVKSIYTEKYVNAPQKRDIYEIRTEDYNYTLYFVKDVSTDSVFVLKNQYQTDMESGLTDMRYQKYDETVYSISKKDIKAMYDKGELIDVERQ